MSAIANLKAKRKTEAHEPVINDDPKFHDTFQPGDVAYQGDLIVVCLAALPSSAKPRSNRQLADGSTQGSRHVLERGLIYDCDPLEVSAMINGIDRRFSVSQSYIGPVFVSPEHPTENDLSHPEHGNQGFPAGSVCAVVYQRSLDSEEREARVQD